MAAVLTLLRIIMVVVISSSSITVLEVLMVDISLLEVMIYCCLCADKTSSINLIAECHGISSTGNECGSIC